MHRDKALRDGGLAALCTHIRETRAAAQSSGSAVAALAEAMDQSLQEIETALNDLPRSTPVTLAVGGWTGDAGSVNYPYRYDIPAEGVTAADRAAVTILPGSYDTAVACGMCPANETVDGAIRLRAARVPAGEIAAEYWVENGKE